MKREIKRAKDLHVRKLVKRLKTGKADAASDAALRQAKEVDVEGLWTKVLDGMGDTGDMGGTETDGHADDVERHLAGSKGVVQQLAVVDELREAVERAELAEREGVDAIDEADKVEGTKENVEVRQGERKDGCEKREREEADSLSKVRSEKKQEKAKIEKKKAKNRMGQRARQRLAEKQYGKDRALHIVENRARDQKRREKQEKKKEKEEGRAYYEKRSDARSHYARRDPKDRKAGIKDDDPASLHPSWQAKKATQKVVIPDISAAAENRPNKIVFDDA